MMWNTETWNDAVATIKVCLRTTRSADHILSEPLVLAAAAVVLVTGLLEDANEHLRDIVKYMPSDQP